MGKIEAWFQAYNPSTALSRTGKPSIRDARRGKRREQSFNMPILSRRLRGAGAGRVPNEGVGTGLASRRLRSSHSRHIPPRAFDNAIPFEPD